MASILPTHLASVLDMRRAITPSADVAKRLSEIPYFRNNKHASTRFPTIGGGGGGGGGGGSAWRGGKSEDGFEVVSSRRRKGPSSGHHVAATATATAPATACVGVVGPQVMKFSSANVKSECDVEERMLARVKGKINKIGPSTYDATKAFMQQILDSEEIAFLDELMAFIFMKAATEPAFCPLYARLLHELADEFGHIRTVIGKLFHDYTDIFTEVEKEPDVGSESYKKFVEIQERKKFRRGYSQFVADLVKLGEVEKDAFRKLIHSIVNVLEEYHGDETKSKECEEYIDCLSNMCVHASSILCSVDWSNDVVCRLSVMSSKAKKDVPGFTNKSRFALMDLVEIAQRGWK